MTYTLIICLGTNQFDTYTESTFREVEGILHDTEGGFGELVQVDSLEDTEPGQYLIIEGNICPKGSLGRVLGDGHKWLQRTIARLPGNYRTLTPSVSRLTNQQARDWHFAIQALLQKLSSAERTCRPFPGGSWGRYR